jgi:NAD(P)-dependent dehydrogenase (short-subunit alcohol dehydrogenase family)
VVGGFNCAAEAIVHLYAQGSGSIVNVTSGAHLGMRQSGDYAATKGAVASMTYSWALDAAGTGVRVNALSPLAISAMSAQTEEYLRRSGLPDTVIEAPTPAESAPAVAYLLSDASAHLSGQIVRADGPRLSLMAHPAIMEPVLYREHWTVDDIARAFTCELSPRQSPVGIAWTPHAPRQADPGTVAFG